MDSFLSQVYITVVQSKWAHLGMDDISINKVVHCYVV